MKLPIFTALTLGLTLFCMTGAHAANLARGKKLVEENCVKCHAGIVGGDGSKIYTRSNRSIDSLPALIKQVHRCKNALGVSWPEDQIADVVAYLNKTYYKFKK
ncbi:MAG: c-type cytochrome [Gammaproteobacteria bacterium]|jgi:mono/diheme cytochrome c family protein